MEGPLGVWVATLRAPPDAAAATAHLEIVASDAAGNVSRRRVPVEIGPAAAPAGPGADAAGIAPLAALAVLALAALALSAAVLLRARPVPPLAAALLAGALEGPRRRGRRS
jgi:hypothetical protein